MAAFAIQQQLPGGCGDNNNGFYGQRWAIPLALPFQTNRCGVSRAVERLWVRVGTGWRRGRERGHQVGHEHVARSTFYYLRDSSLGGAAPPFVGVDPHNEQHQFGATVGGRSSAARRSCLRVTISTSSMFRRWWIPQRFNDGRAAAGHLPEYFGLRSLQSGDWRFGVRSGHCAGCPPASEGGPPCAAPNALAAAVQLSQNGGTKRAQLLGETGSVSSTEYSRRISIFRCGEHGAVLRDEQRHVRFGESITNDALSANGEET